MSLGIAIFEGRGGIEAFTDHVEQDMRRWWRHRCKIDRRPHEIFIEVSTPVKLNVYEGIKRLASFGVTNCRAARSRQ